MGLGQSANELLMMLIFVCTQKMVLFHAVSLHKWAGLGINSVHVVFLLSTSA